MSYNVSKLGLTSWCKSPKYPLFLCKGSIDQESSTLIEVFRFDPMNALSPLQ